MQPGGRKKLLLLTLVHPDFLPPVYAMAQTLRDEGYAIHILTFDSFVASETDLGTQIVIESVGRHNVPSLLKRLRLRKKFARRASEILKEDVVAVIAYCPFSYVTALEIGKSRPVLYMAMEMSDFFWKRFFESPVSYLNNLNTLRSLTKAALVATPSVQRSAWLAGRCHLGFLPKTILNTAYLPAGAPESTYETFRGIVPPHFLNKKIILYTGSVHERLCVLELVKAFDLLQDDSCALLITGVNDNPYGNEIRKFAESSRTKKNIHLLPFVPRAEMLALQVNAHIGVCLVREYEDKVASKMIAPNKVGEYLLSGLYLLGVNGLYMSQFENRSIASLAQSPLPADICTAMKTAINTIQDPNYKLTIAHFVREYFCMQRQLKPVIQLLSTIAP